MSGETSKEFDLFEKLASEGPVGADQLLNEDEILTAEDKKKPVVADTTSNEGTEKKPKKPCANCTCGLADELEKEATSKLESSKTEKSSCGSCYLGDAFRCASCPYRGTPAFKPGEKVVIDTTTDDL